MLTTLICQSRLNRKLSDFEFEVVIRLSSTRNIFFGVGVILIKNGGDLFQVIEGAEKSIDALYKKIMADNHHSEVVELMRDYSSERHFKNNGLEFYDLRNYPLSQNEKC